MPPQDNTKTKKRILLGLAGLTIVVIIASLVFSNSGNNSGSQTKQYLLENSKFSYKLPVDFEPVSSTLESVSVSYIGENKSLQGSRLTISRYLKKDSNNETTDKLKDILLSSADGKTKSEKTATESKLQNSLTILTLSEKSTPNEATKYLLGSGYIWKIQIETKSEQALASLQKTADLIAESIIEK